MTQNLKFSQLFKEHTGKVSDKWSLYLEEWDRILLPYQGLPLNLLEIGIQNGGSLEIWSSYFLNAKSIVGCDINPDCRDLRFEDPRIAVVIGDVNSEECKQQILQQAKTFDVIVDDGSHRSSDIVRSFIKYFDHLNDGGIYLIEDLHCSYWKDFEGGLYSPLSAMAFFKRLADVINFEHWRNNKPRTSVLNEFIRNLGVRADEFLFARLHSIEFLNSLCVIRKASPEKNVLGKRIVVGMNEQVVPGAKRINGTAIHDITASVDDDMKLDVFELMKTVERYEEELAEQKQRTEVLTAQLAEQKQQTGTLTAQLAEQAQKTFAYHGQLIEQERRTKDLQDQLVERDKALQEFSSKLWEIYSSTAWKLILRMWKVRLWLAPKGSRQEGIAKKIFSVFVLFYQNYRLREKIRLIRKSGFFDKEWYLANNPEVAQGGEDPVRHYLLYGGFEGRDPGPNFSNITYFEMHPDALAGRVNPLVHFMKHKASRDNHSIGNRPIPLIVGNDSERDISKQELDSITRKGNGSLNREIITSKKKQNEIGRIAISSGYFNECWYGNTKISNVPLSLHSRNQEDLQELVQYIDDEDTRRIVERYGDCIGGAPSDYFLGLLPAEDFDIFLRSIKIPVSPQNNIDQKISFSIVTTFYRHYNYFSFCASSVFELIRNSSSISIEWIVINDDPSVNAEQLRKVVPHEIYQYTNIVSDGENLGITKRINQAIMLSKNDWILFLDCDDLISPKTPQVLSSYISQFPRCRYISSCMVDIDENGEILRYRHRVSAPWQLMSKGMIAGHLKAVRRDVFNDYGLLDYSYDGCQDYEFALRIAFNEPILFIPEYLYYYRWHTGTVSVAASTRNTEIATLLLFNYTEELLKYKLGHGKEQVLLRQKTFTQNSFQNIDSQNKLVLDNSCLRRSGVVIIRTRGDRNNLLLEALNSVLSQDFPLDVILVVNGDLDVLKAIESCVQELSGNIHLLHAPELHKFRGYPLNIALNKLYESNENYGFLCFLDDDDIFYPMFASKMFEALLISAADFVYCASNKYIPGDPVQPGYHPLPPACLLFENFIPINSYAVRFDRLREIRLLFDEDIPYLEDWDFLIKLFGARFQFQAIDDILSEFRVINDGNTPVKQHPELWELSRKAIQPRIVDISRKLGRYYLYSQLLVFDTVFHENLTEDEKLHIQETKYLIDKLCPLDIIKLLDAELENDNYA